MSTERIQPPLFKVKVSPQSPVGAYTIPIVASMSIQTTSSKLPMFNDTVTGIADPEFQISKKYPTIGYITSKANLTINIIPPLTVNQTLMAFWDMYENAIVLIVAGVVAALSTYLIDLLKSRRDRK